MWPGNIYRVSCTYCAHFARFLWPHVVFSVKI
nr:MAG TPA: hypothetical protein [Bacteriophage sp.]